MEINIDETTSKVMGMLVEYGPKLLLAILLLAIGLRVVKLLVKVTMKGIAKTSTDETLRRFLGNLLSWVLKVMLFISVASMVGIETTSFVAVLGAAGLAVGLALQGTLANFSGGVLCLLFKPYKVGDLISAQGELGVVKEIQIFTTILTSPQNKTIIIPNGAMMNGNITNLSAEGKTRIDLTIGISYDGDIRKAKQVLMDIMEADGRVLKDPAPFVGVSELGDNAVNLAVRPWAAPADYWGVYFDTLEKGKLALDEAKIGIPFPQMDVYVKQVAH